MEKRSAGVVVTPSRLEMFSDAVLAIAITLLVLEIKMPHLESARSGPEAWRALISLWPRFAGYLLSFFFIAVFWVNHHRFFLRIRRVDDGLVWWNVALLLSLSFIPFPTAVIGEYPLNPVPILFFAGVFMLAGIVFNMMWRHARARDLYHDWVARADVAHVVRWGLLGPILYAFAGLLSLASPIPSWILLILIPFLFVIPIKSRG
jgi:uncharacterized membrane protein